MWTFPGYEIGQPLNWEALSDTYSWINDMKTVEQDPIWHAEGNVYVHTQMVVNALLAQPEFEALSDQDKHILVAAALLHDVEKRSTTTTEEIDGKVRIVSPRHAKKGEYTARTLLYKQLKAPFAVREAIAKLVRLHGLPLWAIQKPDPNKAVIEASLVVNTAHLALIATADVLGRTCQDKEEILLRIGLFTELCKDNGCWGTPRAFASGYACYHYLNTPKSALEYVPFNDLKFEVTMLSALPGSGKDTYLKECGDLPVLSLDAIRRAHKIDPTDSKKNGLVVQLAIEQAKVYMRERKDFVFNATNLSIDRRSKWIKQFTDYGGRVKLVYIEVPYKQLLSQNHNREHKVPEKVIERMISKLEIPTPKEAHELVFKVMH